MAHIHLEDGAFSLPWLALWSLLAAGIVALSLYMLGKGRMTTRKLAMAAMAAAVGFAASQIDIPVFGGLHLNLTPLIGILVGPALGNLCALVINAFGAAIGHGGWGMIGANTIVNAVEIFLGYYTYKLMRETIRRGRFASGFVAATLALIVSALLVVGIIITSGIQDSQQIGEEALPSMTVLVAANILTGIFEGLATGYIVSYIGRVRPDLLEESGAETAERATRVGPEVQTNV